MLPRSPLTPGENEPEEQGEIRFLTSDEEYARIANGQIGFFQELATKIETVEDLNSELSMWDRIHAAGAIRAYASQIPTQQPRGRGKAPEIDPGALAIRFALLTEVKGIPEPEARGILADEFDVSVNAVNKSLRKYRTRAVNMLRAFRSKNRIKE